MKKYVILVLFMILGSCSILSDDKGETLKQNDKEDSIIVESSEEVQNEINDNQSYEVVEEKKFQYIGNIFDVTKGKVVTGIDTKGLSTGIAKSTFEDNTYNLLVDFENLPDPIGTDFYEGWVVRKGIRFSVISSGKLEKVNGKYQNIYSSKEDLTDHDFYVLTIEPDDGNPEPAEHILEGTMLPVSE